MDIPTGFTQIFVFFLWVLLTDFTNCFLYFSNGSFGRFHTNPCIIFLERECFAEALRYRIAINGTRKTCLPPGNLYVMFVATLNKYA